MDGKGTGRTQKRSIVIERKNELIFGNLDHARDQNNTFLSLSLTHRETRKLRGSKKTIGWLLTGVLLPSRHVRRIEKWAPPPKKVNFWGIGACPHFARLQPVINFLSSALLILQSVPLFTKKWSIVKLARVSLESYITHRMNFFRPREFPACYAILLSEIDIRPFCFIFCGEKKFFDPAHVALLRTVDRVWMAEVRILFLLVCRSKCKRRKDNMEWSRERDLFRRPLWVIGELGRAPT